MALRKIRWTPKQREILHLVEQGMNDDEIKAQGHGQSSIDRVRRNVKVGLMPPPLVDVPRSAPPAAQTGQPTPQEDFIDRGTIVRDRVLEPVSVGGLFIIPQDWRINQYGGFLILNSLAYAKQKFGYTGTVGDFLCDCVQIARKLMGTQLVPFDYLIEEALLDDGARAEGGEGGNIPEGGGNGFSGITEES